MYFFMGQDTETLSVFKQAVLDKNPQFPLPSGVTLYFSPGPGIINSSLFQNSNFRAGDVDFVKTVNEYGGILSVGMYLGGCSDDMLMLRAIARHESVPLRLQEQASGWVDEFIDYFKALDRPVFLRIAYEFDGGWNCHDPEYFKTTFINIKNRIDERKASNIVTVWQATTTPAKKDVPYDVYAPGHFDLWYPGDEYVDWMALTIFYGENYLQDQFSCYEEKLLGSARFVQGLLLDFARKKGKPVLIAESAPAGYDIKNETSACIFPAGEPWKNKKKISSQKIWKDWFAPFFNFIDDNSDVIRAVAYINTFWDSQGLWVCNEQICDEGLYWGDSRIEASDYILDQMQQELSKEKWVKGNLPQGTFIPPDFSPTPGIYEAEYGYAPLGWAENGKWGTLALRADKADNDRHVMLMLDWSVKKQPSIHIRNVNAGNAVEVKYSAIRTGGGIGTFSLLVNNQMMATQDIIITGSPDEYTSHTFNNLTIKAGDEIAIRNNLANTIIWVDNIKVYNP